MKLLSERHRTIQSQIFQIFVDRADLILQRTNNWEKKWNRPVKKRFCLYKIKNFENRSSWLGIFNKYTSVYTHAKAFSVEYDNKLDQWKKVAFCGPIVTTELRNIRSQRNFYNKSSTL